MLYWNIPTHSPQVPTAPLNNYADLADKDTSVSQHLCANDYMVDVNHRDYGKPNNIFVLVRVFVDSHISTVVVNVHCRFGVRVRVRLVWCLRAQVFFRALHLCRVAMT
jgi:hypothetical protein